MPDVLDEPGWFGARIFPIRLGSLTNAVRAAGPPLLFGVRLWASVCLALYVAFWLELDNPYWAGTTAAIVCQPSVGASLRKGWFRMIGTVVGAVMIVVLTACFPQDRLGFLVGLALWELPARSWRRCCATSRPMPQRWRQYGINAEFGGHGVGRSMHEPPSVPNEGRAGRGMRLQSGLVIAIEPWFLAGGRDAYRIDQDGWTLRSGDGSRAAHVEHTIAVDDEGPRILTAP